MYLITIKKKELYAIDYMLIDNWDVKNALVEFYSISPYKGITCDMFETIIRKIDIECAINLHNALRPEYYITGVYAVDDRPIYKETESEKGETNES